MRRWRKRGERAQAIGRSRGGRTTKIHALTDAFCRPIAFLLTGGQVADCTAADTLLEYMPHTDILHGDKGYDTNAVRAKIENMGVAPNIPPKGPAGSGRAVFHQYFIGSEMRLSACSAASRTSAGSRPDMTAAP
ncbi:IS5 family transposase [Camelimonas fluminis]|nr:IS5 family transposase [Camelimonas fluminis]